MSRKMKTAVVEQFGKPLVLRESDVPAPGPGQTAARPGEWLAISGMGGLGHLAIQCAKAMGLQICAIDIDERKLAHAKRLGADHVVDARAADCIADVKKATNGGAHGVLVTATSLDAFKQCVAITRKRGTCVLVGLPPGDMAEALAFAADGKVKADIELQPLSSINQIFERLGHGDAPSRVVLDFKGS